MKLFEWIKMLSEVKAPEDVNVGELNVAIQFEHRDEWSDREPRIEVQTRVIVWLPTINANYFKRNPDRPKQQHNNQHNQKGK